MEIEHSANDVGLSVLQNTSSKNYFFSLVERSPSDTIAVVDSFDSFILRARNSQHLVDGLIR